MINKIISGGKPGVELAALDAAIRLNIPHEGWAFPRKRTGGGFWPEKYNLKTIERRSYHDRLDKNILNSDGTVILTCGQLVLGSKEIKKLAEKNKKPCLDLDLTKCSLSYAVSSIRQWITNHEIDSVYFTGSKPVGKSNIYEDTIRIIEAIVKVQREQESLPGFEQKDDPNPSVR
jgi:hypothetical protein